MDNQNTEIQIASLAAAVSADSIKTRIEGAIGVSESLSRDYRLLVACPDRLRAVTAELHAALFGGDQDDDAARRAATVWNTYQRGIKRTAERGGLISVSFRKGGQVLIGPAKPKAPKPVAPSYDGDEADDAPSSAATADVPSHVRALDKVLDLIPSLSTDDVSVVRRALSDHLKAAKAS